MYSEMGKPRVGLSRHKVASNLTLAFLEIFAYTLVLYIPRLCDVRRNWVLLFSLFFLESSTYISLLRVFLFFFLPFSLSLYL